MTELAPNQLFVAEAKASTPSVRVAFPGFHPNEQLTISADTHVDAAIAFGKQMKPITENALASDSPDAEALRLTHQALRHFQKLSNQGVFTVNGVDYGKRYIDQIKGFAKGSGISLEKITYLQTELDTGCQTLLIQDKETGRILIAATEENMDDADLLALNRRKDREHRLHQKKRRTQQGYRYRGVQWSEPGKEISFFAYPGLSGGGPAMGINHETKTVTHVDTIFTRTDTTEGIWSNAMASMLLDIGDIHTARIFVNQLRDSGVRFTGGYAVHMAQAGDRPIMTSFEFGGDRIVEVPPKEVGDRLVIAQSNLPRNDELFERDELNLQHRSPDDDPNNPQWYVEMKRRKRRLELMGALVALLKNTSPEKILSFIKNLLANPYGDVEQLKGSRTKDMTGLPSLWTAGYIGAVIEGNTIDAHIGKLRPNPMEDKPYALTEQRATGPRGARQKLKILAESL